MHSTVENSHLLSSYSALDFRRIAPGTCEFLGGRSSGGEIDVIEFTELNEQFHRITMRHDDSWTSRVLGMLTSAGAPYVSYSLRRAPELMSRSNADHYEMLEAFWEKDLHEAIRLETEHLQSTLEVLRATGI